MEMMRKKYYSQSKTKFIPHQYKTNRPKDLSIFPLRYIWNKVHLKGQDCIVLVCGATGSGKTTITTALCELLDRTDRGKSNFPYFVKDMDIDSFNLENPKDSINLSNWDKIVPRFCYGTAQITSCWDWLKQRKKDKKETAGLVVAIDEAQNLWNRREFYSNKNRRAIKHFVEGRFLRTIHFLLCPEFDQVDKGLLQRTHAVIQVISMGVDRITGKGYIKFMFNKPVIKSGKDPWLGTFRDKDGVIQNKPFLLTTPTKALYDLVKAKEEFWKTMDKDDLGNPIDLEKEKEVSEVDSGAKRAAFVKAASEKYKQNRHSFLVLKGGKMRYDSKKIALELKVPVSWGDFFIGYFQEWDKEENIDIQAIKIA